MSNETTDKKKGWPLSLNSGEISEIETMMRANSASDRTEFVLGSLRKLEALKPTSPDLLVTLAEIYHPTGAGELRAALAARAPKAKQARAVVTFLDALVKALGQADFKLDAPFELVDAKRLAEWEEVSEDRIHQLAEAVADYQFKRRKSAKAGHKGKAPTKIKATGQPELVPHPSEKPA